MAKRRWRVWVATALAALVLAGPAAGEEKRDDLGSRWTSLTDAVKKHEEIDDFGSLKADLDVAARLYTDAEGDKSLRSKVVALMASIGKGSKSTDVVRQMLRALATTGDAAAPRTIKGYLKQRDRERGDEVLVEATKVAGEFPDSAYVEPLLTLFLKSKHTGVAACALQSLGSYHDVRNKREKILRAVVENVRKYKPGVKGIEKGYVEGESASASGDHAKNHWQAFSPHLPKTLSRLTGNDLYGATAADWFTMYDDHKRKLSALFVDE